MHQVGTEWAYRLHVNRHQLPGHVPTWRERLATVLRNWAQRIDGQVSLAVTVQTTPPISPAQRVECWRQAVQAWDRALHDTTHAEACEQELRRALPHLWP